MCRRTNQGKEMRLIKIQRRFGMVMKIIDNGGASFRYEYRLKPPAAWRGKQGVRRSGWRHDSTSHQSVSSALRAATEAAEWYSVHQPH